MPNSTQSTKILFLDQSGNIGGAELSLLDVARPYRDRCLVGLFQDGPYRQLLERAQIPVQILTSESLEIRRDSPIWQSLLASRSLISLVKTVIHFSREYDIAYTNTPKAFIVGAIASAVSRHPLVYHLRDILSREHFSWANVQLLTTLANRFATLVIANSQATRQAFIDAGGRPDLVQVVYNGFNVDFYQAAPRAISLGSADLISVSPLPSSEPVKLAEIIHHCRTHPEQTRAIAQAAQLRARTLFSQSKMEQKIDTLLQTLLSRHV
ncbi:MAG: glycosyltransferase [Leptodesmis sp.]|uniref:glycosyltransferase n=1 Tax=Leptodesmis sp. TaxID=3100501 RepID=UPI003D149304